MSKRAVEKVDGTFVFQFPHCDGTVIVAEAETACRIFRHASYKQPGNPPINPHTPKAECDRLVNENLVDGCAKPFLFVFAEPQNYVEICDYI